MTRCVVLAAPTSAVTQRGPWLRTLLTAVERARADAFHSPADRDDFVAAHALARMAVARVAACSPAEVTLVQECDRCSGPHGAPRVRELPELFVSWSHSRGHVAAGAGEGPLGIDVEDGSRAQPGLLDLDVLAEAEREIVERSADPVRAFLETWVRKEALVKAGATTLDQFRSLDLSSSTPPRRRCEGIRTSTWHDWVFTEWQQGDAGSTAVGCLVTRPPPHLGSSGAP